MKWHNFSSVTLHSGGQYWIFFTKRFKYSKYKWTFLRFSAGRERVEQHSQGDEGGPLLQPRAKGGVADHDGASQVPLHQEQLPLPQGQDAEGGNHQTDVQRGGKIFFQQWLFSEKK